MRLPASRPHYILYSSSDPLEKTWRFSICSPHGTPILEVSDWEPDAQGDRLALLPVVLGLEALEQPSYITLCTSSRYVQEGIRFGLPEWQANGWQWECFGQMVPVKNRDLWQRVERAMRFHQVECRSWRFDPPHKTLFTKKTVPPERPVGAVSGERSPEPPADSSRLPPSQPNFADSSSRLEKGCVSGSGHVLLSDSGGGLSRRNSQKRENSTHRAEPLGKNTLPSEGNSPSAVGPVPVSTVPAGITLEAELSPQLPIGLRRKKSLVPLQPGSYFFLVRVPSEEDSEEPIGEPLRRRSTRTVYSFAKRFGSLVHRAICKVRPFLGKIFLKQRISSAEYPPGRI